MIGFMAPIALPAIFVLFSLATRTSIAMGFVALACCAALLWLSFHTNRWITSQAASEGGLRNRNELLHAISVAAKELLTATTVDMAMATVLETIGKAARADRMLVFESRRLRREPPLSGCDTLGIRRRRP